MSRPIGDVLTEARKLFESGVKELLVVSQDTSAYGVDVKYRTGFWDGKPVKTRMFDLVKSLGELAKGYGAWVRLHYVYPYPHVDEVLPLMASELDAQSWYGVVTATTAVANFAGLPLGLGLAARFRIPRLLIGFTIVISAGAVIRCLRALAISSASFGYSPAASWNSCTS